jgi:hypothetical protein
MMRSDGGSPQALEFGLSSPGERDSLFDVLRRMDPLRIEFLDPANTPLMLVELLRRRKVPYDIFIADAGLLGPADKQPRVKAIAGALQWRTPPRKLVSNTEHRRLTGAWLDIARQAGRVLTPCEAAEAFAETILPRCVRPIRTPIPERSNGSTRIAQRRTDSRLIGFILVRSCAQEHALLRVIAGAIVKMMPQRSMTIIGMPPEDMDLMRTPNMYVTGAVRADELERVVANLGVERLFIGLTRPLFGHPILLAIYSIGLPVAYFDWSEGRRKAKKNDLAIRPNATIHEIVGALKQWMQ